jgi:hypothetical protein
MDAVQRLDGSGWRIEREERKRRKEIIIIVIIIIFSFFLFLSSLLCLRDSLLPLERGALPIKKVRGL